jgi:DNA-binding phage protein
VLTNYGLPSYREYALLSGADYFLDKALEFESLQGIVEMVAQQKSLSQLSKDAGLNNDAANPASPAAAAKF